MFNLGREIIIEDGSMDVLYVDYAPRTIWLSRCHWFVPNTAENRMTDDELWALLDQCSN